MLTGYLYMSHQLGSAIGSYLPGILFDQTNSYTSSLVVAAILLGLASLFSALLPKGKETSYRFNAKEANSTT